METVYLDNNAWDILFSRGVDLRTALPPSDYELAITREAEFEIASIPNDALRSYVERSINERQIRTDSYFGFMDESLPPDQQRVGGYGVGRFADLSETTILAQESSRIKPSLRPTGLRKNEADVSFAARSPCGILVTCDSRGVLKQVEAKYGATVVNLSAWPHGVSLGDYIQRHLPSGQQ
ncbi:MAG: hypothetical protein ACKVK5_06670 [Pseudomonadales bacterium]